MQSDTSQQTLLCSMIQLFVLVILWSVIPSVHADDLPVETIIQRAKAAREANLKILKSYKLKLYSKAFFEAYNRKTKELEPYALTQVHSEVYWKAPDQLKEIETARRHLDAFPSWAKVEIYGFGLIDDFGRDDIPVGNVSVIGPLSKNSGLYYDYTLEGSVTFNQIEVYQIRVTPKTRHEPLVDGLIFIANDSYQLAGVDLTFNEAVKFLPKPEEIRLKQKFALYDGQFWLPDELEWMLRIETNFLGRKGKANWHAASQVYDSEVNPDIGDKIFDGKSWERKPEATFKDSLFWKHNGVIPLSDKEELGFRKLAALPKNKKIISPDIEEFELEQRKENIRLGFSPLPDGRYNRVEGFFLGAQVEFKDMAFKKFVRDVTLKTKYGYGFSDEQHKYSVELSKSFSKKRYTFGTRYYDDLDHRELPIAGNLWMNSLTALAYRYDKFNFFYVKGYDVFAIWQPKFNLKFEVKYTDRDDRSAEKNTDYAIVKSYYKFDPVIPINEGRLRRLAFGMKLQFGEGEGIAPRNPYWNLEATVEYSNNDWLKSDFNFIKHYFTSRFHIPTTRRGSFDGKAYFGFGKHSLPQQYLFDLYGGTTPYVLKTVGIGEFQGNYMAAMTIEHNFGGEWLERSGLPLLKDGYIDLIPSFSVGYIDMSKKEELNLVYPVQSLTKPIYEIGFGIGDIFRLARIDFVWRLNQRKVGKQNFSMTLITLLSKY